MGLGRNFNHREVACVIGLCEVFWFLESFSFSKWCKDQLAVLSVTLRLMFLFVCDWTVLGRSKVFYGEFNGIHSISFVTLNQDVKMDK